MDAMLADDFVVDTAADVCGTVLPAATVVPAPAPPVVPAPAPMVAAPDTVPIVGVVTATDAFTEVVPATPKELAAAFVDIEAAPAVVIGTWAPDDIDPPVTLPVDIPPETGTEPLPLLASLVLIVPGVPVTGATDCAVPLALELAPVILVVDAVTCKVVADAGIFVPRLGTGWLTLMGRVETDVDIINDTNWLSVEAAVAGKAHVGYLSVLTSSVMLIDLSGKTTYLAQYRVS